MSDVKREIIFADSMHIDKRNVDFAYLRKNCFKARTKGLYPAKNFYQEQPDDLTGTEDIVDILGSKESPFDIKVISSDGTNLNFNNLGSNTTSNTQLVGRDYECGAFGDDGVHIATDNGRIYKVQHVNSNTTDLGALPAGAGVPHLGGFDGLYYWWVSSDEICKQLGSAAATIAFNDVGLTARFMDFYNDEMVLFAEDAGAIVVLFWDKSDTDLFEKRIVIKNARLIAGGVVNGKLMLIKGIGNSSNAKEQNGEIVVTIYDGEKFQRVNSIKAGDDAVSFEAVTGVGVGSEVMAFSVNGNEADHNTDLYQNYVYKVYDDGAIEVLFAPDTDTYGDVHIVRIFYNYMCLAQRGGTSPAPIIWINEELDEDYQDYEDYLTTEYITNFLNNPYNDHQMDGFMVAFEKLFEQTDTGASPQTGEELDVYFRVSERDTWTLLMNVTAQKVKENINQFRDDSVAYASDLTGMHEQRYSVTKLPDAEESPLPEFNEIQFKFVSKRGFSIIGAWYGYTYLSRNELK